MIGPLVQHGMGESAELPVPMMYAVVGASWALTLSFVVVAWAWREPKFGDEVATGPLPRRPWLAVVGLVATGLILGALFTGPHTDENLGLPAIYTGVWVGLVPLADGRALIALDESMSLADFELAVRDTLERRDLEARERSLVATLSDILRQARRDSRLTVRRILVLRARAQRARARRPQDDA